MQSNHCEKCGGETSVIDSRTRDQHEYLYRRRRCIDENCGHRFSTYEMTQAEFEDLQDIKIAYETLLKTIGRLNAKAGR